MYRQTAIDNRHAPAETLVGRLRGQALRTPGRVAIRVLGDAEGAARCLDYAEVDRRARRIGALLAQAGARGERALILHPPGIDYIASLLACLYAGVVAVPAYPPSARALARLEAIAADCHACFALGAPGARATLAAQRVRAPVLAALRWPAEADGAMDGPGDAWEPQAGDPLAIAVLQYTSGSTSAPKGVQLTQANLLDNIDALNRQRGPGVDDRLVCWLPPFHDMGLVFGILLPLSTGVESTLISPMAFMQRPYRWLAAISEHGATISGGPNFAYELCVRRVVDPAQIERLDLRRWRVAFCGAERVRPETLERFAAAFAPAGFRRNALTACYGLAESTVAVSFGALDAAPRVLAVDSRALGAGRVEPPGPAGATQALASCGRPLGGCEVLVVDPERCRAVAPDRVGEIWLRSASVGSGYWGKPELSAQVFRAQLAGDGVGEPAYLRTGDLGFVRDGELYVVGRIKDLIILRGSNHYPEDIEITAQASHARLRAGAAFGVEVHDEEQLVLVQEVDAAAGAPLAEIAAAITGAIAREQELAVHVVLVPAGTVPRTSSGKVQRALCRRMYLDAQLKVLACPAPEPLPADAPAELVERVARLMADVLGLPELAPDDDFFWLGGHSLMATQLVSRLAAELSIELALRAVFEARTPRRLAVAVAEAPPRAPLPPIVPLDRAVQPLRLSYSQERMWLLHQLDPRSAAYNVAGALAIDGPLDPDALRLAFDELLARHEVLRSNYTAVDGEPRVRIAPRARFALGVIDLSTVPDGEAAAIAAGSALAHAPFDIAADPLMRAALYRIGPQRHVACVCLHHLVTDAWSLGLLVEDLMQCYEAFAAGRAPALPERQIAYVDYAHWQRENLGGERLAGQMAYWKGQLAGAVALELPSDRPRSRQRSAAGALEPLVLPQALMEGLAALGNRRGTTLFMVMLAAFEALLHRHTGSDDLVVGIPVANRNCLEAEPLMGSLVNTLALRLRLDGELPFTRLLDQVREIALDAYANQDLPFERLVAELPVERRPGESPIVSVMFDFQNAPFPGGRAGALRLRPLVLARGAAQFDLSLLVFDTELGRTAGIEYSTDLFDAASVRRLLGHYRAILDAIVADPQTPVSRLPIIGRAERAELLSLAAPECAAASLAPLVERAFAEQARRTPHAPAVLDDAGTLDYAQLEHESAVLAAALAARGAGPGERVGVYLERDRRLPLALLAVLKCGAAYVPLDPRHPSERIAYMLADAQPRVLLTRPYLRAKLAPDMAARCLTIDETGRANLPAAAPPAPVADRERSAYLIYTSGSTGRPKGVEVPAGALANFVRSMQREPGIGPGERLLAVTTIAFDIAGLELWLPLASGASVRLASSDAAADGAALLELLRSWRPTIMQATPATWKLLLESGWAGDRQLKALCGGEAFAPELAQTLRARCHSVWNMYGPTETTIWSTLHRTRDSDGARVPIGRPIDDTRIYILDRHGELQPRGVAGEITIGGAGVAKGYFGRPDLTSERFVADPFAAQPGARMYRTGDAGRLRADGRFECLARLDDQIKLRGFRIEPGEIEAVLKEDARLRDAVVVAREDRPGDQRLVAYVVPARPVATAPLPVGELLEPLQRRLPAYMVPSAIVALAALPRTPNGKIDRKRLPAPQAGDSASGDDYVAPRDQIEADLAGLWEQILATAPVGVRDSFFQLGGHSLLAVRMFARVERHFGVALPLACLIERPTVEFLAELIRARQRAPAFAQGAAGGPARAQRFEYLVPIQRRGARAPLVCVHGAGGDVLNFEALSSRLGVDRPFFAIQARGVDGRTRPHARVEDMAQAYLGELRRAQATGPYYLAGYCGGGIIAYEMARRLRAAGQCVALLALLDCYRPGVVLRKPRHLRWTSGLLREGFAYLRRKAAMRVRRDVSSAIFWLRVAACRILGRPVAYDLRGAWLTRAFLDAARHYRPGVYPGAMTVLRAAEVDPELLDVGPELGWSGYAAGGVQSFEVPGDHHSLLEEPNIGALAATLGDCLRAAEARAAP